MATTESLAATGDAPIQKLTRSLDPDQHDEYVVQVFKCNRSGRPKTFDPYYERRYQTQEQALDAHREAVHLLSTGKLRLKRIPKDLDDLFLR
ncbi:MAG: hypothetical protein ACHP7P_09835 [Terriglobales bacterium]